MKEQEPRLTSQSNQSYTGREGESMQQGPDQPEEGAGGGVATAADTEGYTRERISREEAQVLVTNRKARDKVFNDLFNLVDAQPHKAFLEAFDIYSQEELRSFYKLIGRGSKGELRQVFNIDLSNDQMDQLARDFERYQAEQRLRQALHDVNRILYFPSVPAPDLFDAMQQFGADQGDIALKTPGVVQMMRLFEQVLREDMAKNEGYLRPEAVTGHVVRNKEGQVTEVHKGEVEIEIRKRFVDQVRKGLIDLGEMVDDPQDIKPWEVDRIFSVARGMMIMTERLISLAAESNLPKDSARYTSLFMQDVIAKYSGYQHLLGKFGVTEQALAAYLHTNKKADKLLGFLTNIAPENTTKAFELFNEKGLDILNSSSEFYYLMRRNPNRAGDMFTWLTWRANENPEIVSMIQEFATKGREDMKRRWNAKNPSAKAEDYDNIIRRYKLLSEELIDSEDPQKERKEREFKDRMNAEWTAAHGGAPSIEEYEKFIDEYTNWIGVGLRFEKIRGPLDKLDENAPWEVQRARWEEEKGRSQRKIEKAQRKGHKHKEASKELKSAEDVLKAMDNAAKLLKKMTELMPHKLYPLSADVKKRINQRVGLTDERSLSPEEKRAQDERINTILADFSLLETAFLNNRERFLDEGKTFDGITLNELLTDDRVIQDASRREEVRRWLRAFDEDFEGNKEKYFDEFILKREYRHGFVLWSGDAPLNEFNFGALGATTFARRARDNKSQVEATDEEIKLLLSLQKVRRPEDLIKLLEPVYDKIAVYDAGKAKQAIYEKLRGLAMLFGRRASTNVPIYGILERIFGKASAGKVVFGKSSPAWGSVDLRNLFQIAREEGREMLDKDQYNMLVDEFASEIDVAVDTGLWLVQLLMAWALLHLLKNALKEK